MNEANNDTGEDDRYQVQWQDTSDGETDGTDDLADSESESEISKTFEAEDEEVFFTEGDRLSHILQGWMPDYTVTPIEPHARSEKEPLYSAKLGKEPRVKRIPSCESIVTQLSLLSCSTYGKNDHSNERKRRKRKSKGSRPVTCNSSGSKWIALANRRQGMFDKMLRQQTSHAAAPGLGDGHNIAFDMMDEDEKKLLFRCGLEAGLNMAPGLKKSDSSTNINRISQAEIRRFSHFDVVPTYGKKSDFKELQKQAARQNNILLAKKSSPGSNRSLNASNHSKQSVTSAGRDIPTFNTPTIRTVTPPFKEKVRMWQVDEQIMDVDLKGGVSDKVKKRIASTNIALERVSRVTGTRPNTTLTNKRTIINHPQNIRISPELSSVIQQDIRMRMGRPRYHEIRKQDVQIWDRGQQLNRSHRNLKVFNWLHSLQEDKFDSDIESGVRDDLSTPNSDGCGFVHVDSVDEPAFKPLSAQRTI
ncbi:uncharacterized protein LOC126815915 [Patella vulgata]|uniref:uncharacterized protein LOC126815915 n=1 Tax=Patella vulgata TaxID=6465 RepID=UPI0024A99DFD|nr:uncharacterized protein LOC126815915 [Patella vulgata]XP_050397974.2 uncharacterized protein LOC126815915 [Patella vulgata]